MGAGLPFTFGADQRQRMLRTEYGGMNEVLANLAAITKNQRYLRCAHLFEQPGFLDPLAERRDELQGLHANTHVPKIIGAARMYEVPASAATAISPSTSSPRSSPRAVTPSATPALRSHGGPRR